MAYDVYLSIEDAEGNLISEGASGEDSIGAFAKEEHEDEISILELSWGMTIPTDRLTGQITANRRHEGLVVKKHLDSASPQLAQCVTNPVPLTLELTFFRPADTGEGGEPVELYNITFEGAKVISVRVESPDMLDPDKDHMPAFEVVTFAYGSVEAEHAVCSTTFADSWSAAA